ncbi:hypothetical protein HU200_042790 [Digitaria exilis]|uniref:Uncharacterized protein n=1 Tax=Digitaria exilis TaxID=1010633 RepID=A0A835B4C7_9POAL|nr:hypothetical protein HU200_042790 [Digitaria exilis]
MWPLLLSPAPLRPPLPTPRRRPVSSYPVASAPPPKPRFTAPRRAAATRGTGTSSYAAGRSSLPRHLPATAAVSVPSDPTPLYEEDEAARVKLAQVGKKLEKTARYFKNLGNLGFLVPVGVHNCFGWNPDIPLQLLQGIVTAPFTFSATAVGINLSLYLSFPVIWLHPPF